MIPNQPLPFNGPLDVATASSTVPGTVFPSLSRAAATYTSQEYANLKWAGLRLIIDITNVGGGPGTVVVTVEHKNPITGTWHAIPLMASGTLNATGATILTMHPGVTETANVDVATPLPSNFRIKAVVGTNAVTFSLWGEFLS